jgi:Cysteine dioxygenase type I
MHTEELRNLAESLGSDSSTWRHLVRHDPLERVFERVVDEPEVEGWLICWMPGHDTGFHDHDVSSGAVTVLHGQVLEERLTVGRAGMLSAIYSPGETFGFSPSDIRADGHAARLLAAHRAPRRLHRVGRRRAAPPPGAERPGTAAAHGRGVGAQSDEL